MSMMKNLGKFSESQFQSLKQGLGSTVKSLGKVSEASFQLLKKGVSEAHKQGVLGVGLPQYPIVDKALNPGSEFVSPYLEKKGINPMLAGGAGLGIDILAPGPGEVKSLAKGVTKLGQEALKDSIYNRLKKLKFPATIKNPIEHFETQSNIISKIEKGTATADDLRSGSELIKLMESGKSSISKASGQSFDEWVKGQKQVFHGTDTDFTNVDVSKSKRNMFGRGFSVTEDSKMTKYYGSKQKDFILDPNIKIYESSSAIIKDKDFKLANRLYKEKYGKDLPIAKAKKELMYRNDVDDANVFWKSENPEILKAKEMWGDYIKSQGYDAVREADTINVLNVNKLKTRSQLKAGWDKAKGLKK